MSIPRIETRDSKKQTGNKKKVKVKKKKKEKNKKVRCWIRVSSVFYEYFLHRVNKRKRKEAEEEEGGKVKGEIDIKKENKSLAPVQYWP